MPTLSQHLLYSGLGVTLGALLVLYLPCRSMKFTWRAEPGHARSFAMHVIDPAGNPTQEESYTLRIPLRDLKPGLNDEEILARFSKGYFAGVVFAPERWIAPFVQGIIDHEGMSLIRWEEKNDAKVSSNCKRESPQARGPSPSRGIQNRQPNRYVPRPSPAPRRLLIRALLPPRHKRLQPRGSRISLPRLDEDPPTGP
jgi:hypothetical protein